MCYLCHYIRAEDSAPLPSDQKSTKKRLFILDEAPKRDVILNCGDDLCTQCSREQETSKCSHNQESRTLKLVIDLELIVNKEAFKKLNLSFFNPETK